MSTLEHVSEAVATPVLAEEESSLHSTVTEAGNMVKLGLSVSLTTMVSARKETQWK